MARKTSAQSPASKATSPPSLTLKTSCSEPKPTDTTPSSSGPSASSLTPFGASNPNSTTSTQTTLSSIMSPSDAQQSVSPQIQSLASLIGGLRQTVVTMQGTCGLLEKSIDYVAKAGPAIKGAEELEKVRNLLLSQKAQHEAQLAKLEIELSSSLQEAIKSSLRDEALKLVKERIREELPKSVNGQLHLQIPVILHDQTLNHPTQMLQVRTSVHNSEARARNSVVRAGSDKLRPLWLPDGKPHPLFPATVRDVAELSNSSVEALLEGYGVIVSPPQTNAQDAAGIKKSRETGSLTREERINCFMTFIGVPLRVILIPSTSSGKEGKKSTSTSLISSCF